MVLSSFHWNNLLHVYFCKIQDLNGIMSVIDFSFCYSLNKGSHWQSNCILYTQNIIFSWLVSNLVSAYKLNDVNKVINCKCKITAKALIIYFYKSIVNILNKGIVKDNCSCHYKNAKQVLHTIFLSRMCLLSDLKRRYRMHWVSQIIKKLLEEEIRFRYQQDGQNWYGKLSVCMREITAYHAGTTCRC